MIEYGLELAKKKLISLEASPKMKIEECEDDLLVLALPGDDVLNLDASGEFYSCFFLFYLLLLVTHGYVPMDFYLANQWCDRKISRSLRTLSLN